MRVLVLGRLFSGLKDGVAEGAWRPKGVPAFYKLVEGLHADGDVELLTVLACKDADPAFARDFRLESAAAGTCMVLGWKRPTGGRVRRLDVLATEISRMMSLLWIALRFRPDIVFATYALVLPAAVMARMGRNVVLRLMGIFPHHRTMAEGRFRHFRWALRSPFRAVVCTEDGSDPSMLLPDLVRPGTELVVRLNGCDVARPRSVAHAPNDPPRILFVGRLEDYKGCETFVDAAIACLEAAPASARFEIIGGGSLQQSLESKVARAKQQGAIAFRGALPHGDVVDAVFDCDIYVSVNLHGNLSNANLEALAAGACLVIPTSDPATPIDTSTDGILPDEVALRYDRTDLPESLTRALGRLVADRDAIERRRMAVREHAAQLLKPWAETIGEDIDLLRRIAGARKAGRHGGLTHVSHNS